jgi:hypothetical protein
MDSLPCGADERGAHYSVREKCHALCQKYSGEKYKKNMIFQMFNKKRK